MCCMNSCSYVVLIIARKFLFVKKELKSEQKSTFNYIHRRKISNSEKTIDIQPGFIYNKVSKRNEAIICL